MSIYIVSSHHDYCSLNHGIRNDLVNEWKACERLLQSVLHKKVYAYARFSCL